ncbi:MAG: hypothetical protein WCK65_10385 [Rhodospirillaceae bacterium]
MMPSPEELFQSRKDLLVTAGKMVEDAFYEDGVKFIPDSDKLSWTICNYQHTRDQFVRRHKMVGGLLANHKVAAIYIHTITRLEATEFFLFQRNNTPEFRRSVLVSMMYILMYGLLSIRQSDMDEHLKIDIDYCLLVPEPDNLEWLCLTMHAICRLCGTATNSMPV